MYSKKRNKICLIFAILVAWLVLITWIIWGNGALTVEEIVITSKRIPTPFTGFRMVQVSDLHNCSFGEDNQTLLDMIQKAKPDIIVLTGDFVDSRHTDLAVALAFAKQSVKIAPTYYVTGNHEARITEWQTFAAKLKISGVKILENETVQLKRDNAVITLAGVHDPMFQEDALPGASQVGTQAEMAETISDLHLSPNTYTVLLSHRPELFDVYVANNVDLVLTGHAHGGQIRLPFIGGLVAPGQGLFPKYDAGLFERDDTQMIVSRGLGNSIFPLRINNRPQLVVITLASET